MVGQAFAVKHPTAPPEFEDEPFKVEAALLDAAGALVAGPGPVETVGELLTHPGVELEQAGTRLFTGLVTTVPFLGSARRSTIQTTVSGPWWYLDNLIYQETRKLREDPEDEESALVDVFSSRAVLFQDAAGAALKAEDQAAEALNFVIGRGGEFALGTIDLDITVPFEEGNDLTVSEVIKRCVRWAPDAVAWFDYAPEVPVLHIRRRADLTPLNIDLADADLVVEWSARKRDDLLVSGVRFFIEDIVTLADGSTRGRLTTQSAGTPDAFGAIVAVIELGGQGSETPEPAPAGLAAAFYASVSQPIYEGTLRLKERTVSGVAGLGRALNLANSGQTALASMAAPVQDVLEDLFTGETTVNFGASNRLGAAEFVDFIRYQNQRKKSSYITSRLTGEGVTSAVPPIALAGWLTENVEIELCNPERTIRVQATTVV